MRFKILKVAHSRTPEERQSFRIAKNQKLKKTDIYNIVLLPGVRVIYYTAVNFI